MTISLSSDLVLDVMRNADPSSMRKGLNRLHTSPSVADNAFPDKVARSHSAALTQGNRSGAAMVQSLTRNLAGRAPSAGADKAEAMQKLESLLLKQVFEEMLPKNLLGSNSSVLDGSVWRSFLAESLAEEVSKRVSLGLAGRGPSVTK